jgi:16S rRNA (cytosine967-C5)-methyltransferase
MRLHRNLVYTTIDALNAIFNEGEYADKVVARSLKTNAGEAQTVCCRNHLRNCSLERLYAESRSKEPLTEIIFANVFCLGSIKRIPNS